MAATSLLLVRDALQELFGGELAAVPQGIGGGRGERTSDPDHPISGVGNPGVGHRGVRHPAGERRVQHRAVRHGGQPLAAM